MSAGATTSSKREGISRQAVFVTTHWSVVLTAARKDTARAHAALSKLCQTYWHPLYVYVRRRGYSPHDAEDLTQEFFARLLERNRISGVDPDKGRFRSFLLGSMNHFLMDEWDKARAQKRGGGKVLPMDVHDAETRLGECVSAELTPEQAFEQRWAIALLEQVYQELAEEYRMQGNGALFEALKPTLAGPSNSAPYAQLATQLNMSEGAIKVAVHRLRQRYRQLLRNTIADTVASPEEADEELRHMIQTLSLR